MIDTIYRPAIALPRRRSPESPTLWLLLLAGSILLHVALFLILRPFWVERSGGQGGDGAIAIELVDTNPVNDAGTGQASLPPQSVSAKAAPIAAAPPAPLPENDQEIQAPPRSPQPPPSPPASLSSPPPASPLQGKPKANSKPSQVAPPPPQPMPKLTPPPVQPPLPPLQPSAGLLKSGEILPSAPAKSNESGGGSATTAPEVVQTTVEPSNVYTRTEGGGGLRMTIVGAPRAIKDKDIPDEAPQLLSPRDLPFPGLLLPPCLRRSSGKLTFVLVIDRQTGKPKPEQVDNGSICDASIAKLVRDNIQFRPARQAGGRVEGQVQIELQLTSL